MTHVKDARLSETPPETWSNTILWKLADALGYGDPDAAVKVLDPDQLLEEALETIWRYQDMADS